MSKAEGGKTSGMERDDRRLALCQWIEDSLGAAPEAMQPASSDASFRRYFRASVGGRTLVFMDAPPEHEDCRPFVRVAGLMAQAGLNVPRVVAQDLEQGFLALSDLGTVTYLDALDDDCADRLFDDAIDALIRWQRASRPGVLPLYDQPLLRRELELFPEWYLERHLGLSLSAGQRAALDRLFRVLEEDALAQPQVYVHRDYMPRNLMVSDPNPGVLDFQDAVWGPVAYDVTSLFKDAFVSWDEARVEYWWERYWQRARDAGVPVHDRFETFRRACDYIGLQRHLKVLGIFARIRHRDGKPRYLEDAPRFVRYVRTTAIRYPELEPLLGLLDEAVP